MARDNGYILTEYIESALSLADYDKLGDGTFAGKIAECPGVISFGNSLEECRSNVRSTLEDWILLGLRFGHRLPTIKGLNLNPEKHARKPSVRPAKRRKERTLNA